MPLWFELLSIMNQRCVFLLSGYWNAKMQRPLFDDAIFLSQACLLSNLNIVLYRSSTIRIASLWHDHYSDRSRHLLPNDYTLPIGYHHCCYCFFGWNLLLRDVMRATLRLHTGSLVCFMIPSSFWVPNLICIYRQFAYIFAVAPAVVVGDKHLHKVSILLQPLLKMLSNVHVVVIFYDHRN